MLLQGPVQTEFNEKRGNFVSEVASFCILIHLYARYSQPINLTIIFSTILILRFSPGGLQYLFRKKGEGEEISWHEMHVFVMERDKEGMPTHAVVAFTDVNKSVQEEMQAQKQLEKALEDAQVANKAKTTFLFNMSHDIRTPMNAILGYTDMA